jgi:hypothetical protein
MRRFALGSILVHCVSFFAEYEHGVFREKLHVARYSVHLALVNAAATQTPLETQTSQWTPSRAK